MCATPARHRAPRKIDSTSEGEFWAASRLLQAGQSPLVKRVREGSSRYAVHIGRVGALAVSLGVGLAVATSSGAAFAESDTTDSPASANDSGLAPSGPTSPSSASGDGQTSAGEDPTSGADTSSDESGTSTDSSDSDGDQNESESASGESADDSSSDGGSDSASPDTSVDGDSDASGGAAADVTVNEALPPSSGSSSNGSSALPGGSAAEAEDESSSADDEQGSGQNAGSAEDAGSGIDIDDVSDGEAAGVPPAQSEVVTTSVVTSTGSDVPQMVASPEEEAIGVVAGLASTLVAPVGSPAAPAASPLTDLFLAYVRRILVHTFLNKTPIAGPIVTELPIPAGARTFEINASDPNGDLLSYTIVQPEHGVVTQIPFTSKFIYTPKTLIVTGETLVDSFQVIVKDSTLQHLSGPLGNFQKLLHDISKFFGIAKKDDLVVTVPVSIEPLHFAPLVATAGTPFHVIGGPPVTLLSSATITDVDSDNLSGATLKITTLAQDGDELGYSGPLAHTWDAGTKTLTLTGVASKADYETALESVTFSATGGVLIPRTVEIYVTDTDNETSLVPGLAIANARYSLAPSVATLGAPTFTLEGAPVTVLSSATITDLDSDDLTGATVVIGTLAQAGDVLSYSGPLAHTWDGGSFTLTLSGLASKADYEAALESITFSATGGAGLIRGIGFTVTDDDGVDSLTPGAALVNVAPAIHLPPTVTTLGVAMHTINTPPVTLLSSATITDLDSDDLTGATVKIATLAQAGDVLSYSGPLTSSWDGGSFTLTLSGLASKADYEAALESVKFSATGGVGWIRGITVTVTDDAGVTGTLPLAATAASRNNSTPVVTTLPTGPYYKAGNSAVTLDGATLFVNDDSAMMSGATVTIANNKRTGDVLSFTPSAGISGSYNSGTGVLSLTGAATKADYQAVLRTVKFYTPGVDWWDLSNRTFVFAVTDQEGATGSSVGMFMTVNAI